MLIIFHFRLSYIKRYHKIPRSNKHGRKRPYTKKYGDLHVIVLRSYISVSYTDKYGGIQTKMRSFTVLINGDYIQNLRFSPYTEIYDRNTITGITAKHGRKRLYFPVYGYIRPFTAFATFNLGKYNFSVISLIY